MAVTETTPTQNQTQAQAQAKNQASPVARPRAGRLSGQGRLKIPHSLEAEQACLGALILKNSLYEIIFPKLRENDFYDIRHQKIVKAIENYRTNHGDAPFDTLTIADELTKTDDLKSIGGLDYLNELTDSVPTTTNIEQYAHIIKEKSNLRMVIEISEEAIDRAITQDESQELLGDVLQNYFSLVGDEYQDFEHIKVALTESVKLLMNPEEASRRILSGFKALDEIITGFRRSNLIILGGRTGMGKTALAINILERISLGDPLVAYESMDGQPVAQQYKVGFFSLEMSKREICYRILSSQAGIGSKELITLNFEEGKWQNIINTVDKLNKSQIYIDDTPGIKLQELVNKAKKMKNNEGVEIIFVDYLQLIQVQDSRMPREQQISEISKQLKNLARDLDIPVVALTQLNRSADTREDKTPRLSDIRESGAIEQDADIVLFISDDYQKKEDEESEIDSTTQLSINKILTVAKNRHGPTGFTRLNYEGRFLRFHDFTPSFNEPGF